jgi:DNA-binding response OmpR family regulator
MKQILVVEDDEILNEGLCYNLGCENFATSSAYNSKQAMSIFLEKEWDLILLDVNLPDGNGFDLSKKIREGSKAPIIFITACDLDRDVIKGFDVGADDYITKPFNIKIVIQRIRAILRRCESESDQTLFFGNLEINFENHSVKKSSEPLVLTPTEYKLLEKFCNSKGRMLTRQVLLEDLWDQEGNFVDEHTLTINISRLRSKIADEEYPYIKTIYGMGYQWLTHADGR